LRKDLVEEKTSDERRVVAGEEVGRLVEEVTEGWRDVVRCGKSSGDESFDLGGWSGGEERGGESEKSRMDQFEGRETGWRR
jgi:hypothetical protein